ncbi:SDR family NAD(P)-dependent oxidoreductase [Bradyrhizobium guangxiense]|uniref:SDR family NAD(P)-dependent oxidoreductase n=1 Tax=Bradyrhizobium guangxiense TaxID=1325115 RepID=UPI001008A3E3|nr:SDR family oxidoreductase [Bradyrhizobium guangxiense]
MQISLKSRTAIVTGGSRGIGRAIALAFAEAGASVAILARDKQQVSDTADQISSTTGQRVIGISCDLGNKLQIDQAWSRLSPDFSHVDVLVNNAGNAAQEPISGVEWDALQSDFMLKVGGALYLTQRCLSGMRARRWGRVVNILSIAAKAGTGAAPSALSRAAGLSMTKLLANECAPDNVLINAICLGSIETDQWKRMHRSTAPQASYEDFVLQKGKSVRLGRLGTVTEVANVACFLASDLASFVTGTAINVDGGNCPVP